MAVKKFAGIFAIGTVFLSLIALSVVRYHVPTWKKAVALQSACKEGNLDAIEESIAKLGNANGDSMGDTALHICVRLGHLESLEYLLSKGGNVNIRDCSLQTPLHCAVRNSSRTVSGGRVCYERSANAKGLTMIKFLIANGADITAVDKDGKTARDWADALGFTDVSKLLAKT